jgi:hypothetical protein
MRVTAPDKAYNPPETETAPSKVIEVKARMLPTKIVAEPSVADDPTAQNTPHGCAPFARMTFAAVAVIRVDPIWKMNTAFWFPWPSRVNVPVMKAELLKQ